MIHPVTLLKSVMYSSLAVVTVPSRVQVIGRPHSLVSGYRLPCTGIPTLARALCMRELPPRTQRGRLPCTYRVAQPRGGLESCSWTLVGARCLLPLYLFLHVMRFSSRLLYCVYIVSCP